MERTKSKTDIGEQLNLQHVLQGETRISNDPSLVLTTILGSCVSACIWDDHAKVGGMNHFLVPGQWKELDQSLCHGVHSMELLVNALICQGGERSRFKAKLIGGAKMYEGGKDIGKQNYEFAAWFLKNEGFPIASACIGGNRGRKVRFWPTEGRLQRCFMTDFKDDVPSKGLTAPPERMVANAQAGHIELFDIHTQPAKWLGE